MRKLNATREATDAEPKRKQSPAQVRQTELLIESRRGNAPRTNFGRGVFKVDAILRDADRKPYAEFLRDPGTTHAKAHQWLRDRGYDVGVDSVANHRNWFNHLLVRTRDAAHLARAFTDVAREGGPAALAEASAALAEQQMMQALFAVLDDERDDPDGRTEDGEAFDAKRWQDTHKAIGEAIKNRVGLEALRAMAAKLEAATAVAEKGERAGLTGRAIAARIRGLLGVPAASADEPDDARPRHESATDANGHESP